MNRPQGSEPTGMLVGAKPFAVRELCQTSSRLNAVFERNTLPRAASTAMSPIVALLRQRVRAAVDDERGVDSAALTVAFRRCRA